MKASIVLASLSIVACSGSSSSGWTGTWSCDVTDTLNPAGASSSTSTWTQEWTVTQGSNGQITLTPIVDAGTPCSIVATASGSTATIQATQSCVGSEDATYGGSATLNGSSLAFDETGSSSDGSFGTQGTCTRQ